MPGQKIRIAGAEFEFVKDNPDGTITVRSDSGEFSTEPGEKWTPLAKVNREPNPSIESITEGDFVAKRVDEMRNARAARVAEVEAKIEEVFRAKGIKPHTGYSAAQTLSMMERPRGELRGLATEYKIAKENAAMSLGDVARTASNVYKLMRSRSSEPSTAPQGQGVPRETIPEVVNEGQPGDTRQPQVRTEADQQPGTRKAAQAAETDVGTTPPPAQPSSSSEAPVRAAGDLSYPELVAEAKRLGVYAEGPKTRVKLVERVEGARTNQPIVPNAAATETNRGSVPTGVQRRKRSQQADAEGASGEAPPSAPPPEAPARRANRGEFSKADIERRLIAWQERSAYSRSMEGILNADSDAAYERGEAAVIDTSFSGPLPREVKDFIDGHPYLRSLFKGNSKGGTGADVAAQIGYDAYFEKILEARKGKMRSALEALERVGESDPEANLLRLMHSTLPSEQASRKPYHVIDKPGDLPDGTAFEMGGTPLRVKRDGQEAYLTDENGHAISYLTDAIPIDAGSLRLPKAAEKERRAPAQPGLLGERFDVTKESQASLIDTRADKGSALDAEQAERDKAKVDDEETSPMFEEAKWHHGMTLPQLREAAREVGARDRGGRAELIAAIESKVEIVPDTSASQAGPRQKYQITRSEWTSRARSDAQRESMGLEHEKMVTRAVREGKDVPSAVLKDYPQLEKLRKHRETLVRKAHEYDNKRAGVNIKDVTPKGYGPSEGLASPVRSLPAPSSIKPSRIQPDPISGGASKQVSEIMLDLEKDLGQVRAGRSARGSIGTYYPGSSKTIVRFSGDLDTAAHEAAHRLDDLYGIVADWAKPKGFNKAGKPIPQRSPFDAELGVGKKNFRANPIFQQTIRDGYKLTAKRAEAVAEYLRAWMLNPDEAAKHAPKFTAFFESKVPAEVRNRMRSFGDDVRRWAGSDALTQAASNIRFDFKKPGIFEKAKEAFEGEGVGGDFLTKMNAAAIDSLAPVWKGVALAKQLRGIADLLPSHDPKTRLRLFAGFDRKVMDVLAHGPVKFNGERVTDVGGIDWLLEPLKADSKAALEADMKALYGYMVSERVVERVELMNKAVEKVETLSKEIAELRADIEAHPGMIGSAHERLPEAIKERNEAMRKVGYKGPPLRMRWWADQKSQRMSGAGAGIFSDAALAKQALEAAQGDPARLDRIKEAARRHRAWSNAMLDYMVQGGRIASETAKSIRESNQFYVAMKRLNETVSDQLYGAGGSGGKRLASARQPIQRFSGSTKEIENPFVSLIDDTYQMMRETDRNAGMVSIVRLLDRPRGMYEGPAVDFDQIGSKAAAGDQDAIKVYRRGELEHWQFAPAIHKALQNWGISKNPDIAARSLQALTRWTRNTITLAPQFIIRQQIRDPLSRAVISREGTKPWEQFYFLTPNGRSEFAQIKSEFDRAGGGLFGHRLVTKENYYRRMRDALKEASGDGNTILSVPGKLARGYTAMAESGETINRLAEYRRAYRNAKSMGMSDLDARMKAAAEARDLQDFAVAGTFVRSLNDYVPFTAAAVRGMARSIESAVKTPGKFAARWAAYIGGLELANYAWNYFQGSEDDERELSAYRRDFFWNYRLGDWGWLSIPKPYELGVMGSGLSRTLDAARGVPDAFKGYAGSFFQAASPLEPGDLLGPLKPLVSVMSNHDFFTDRPIVPDWEAKKPPGMRKGELRASRIGQLLGEWLGVDARYVDQFIRTQLGGFGTLVTKATNNENSTGEALQDAGATATGVLYKNRR